MADDGHIEDITRLLPISQELNVPMVSAVISQQVGSTGFLNAAQGRQLIDAGWEIASHTLSHPHLLPLTDTQLAREIQESKARLEAFGWPIQALVYPYGDQDSRIQQFTQQAGYKAGVGTQSGINVTPQRLALQRVAMGAYAGKAAAESNYKARVDEALKAHGWLIFMLHPWHPDHTEAQQNALRATIRYAQSGGAQVVTLSQGLAVRDAEAVRAGQ
ncbi:polysaccharide deacetylase family protein [Deinococcus aquatilis]|uniref:polysaccharide deacetylase family protein n=1 Tax=Deinococcus aquatilis TaxID=519440 RepID=UPI00146BEDA3|nr:polysaccharide deacetylase family protein [Deinococcus aquatilis]